MHLPYIIHYHSLAICDNTVYEPIPTNAIYEIQVPQYFYPFLDSGLHILVNFGLGSRQNMDLATFIVKCKGQSN